MERKRFTLHVLAAMIIAAWASACVQGEAPGEEAAGALETAGLPEELDALTAIDDVEETALLEEGQPGETFEESVADDPYTAAGCSRVEWCNAPGKKTVVCKRQGGCSCAKAWNECYDEVFKYCGALPPGPIYMIGCGWEW